MSLNTAPNMRPLRIDEVRGADAATLITAIQQKLGAYGARFVRKGFGGAPVYMARSGHLIRVVGRSSTIAALEFYPAGCAC